MQIVIIDGWWGSGKSTIKGMLDGHPSLLVAPIQDSFVGGLATDPTLETWLKHRDIEIYRRFLAAYTNYYRIEKYADWSEIIFQPNSSDIHRIKFDFHFLEFDLRFKKLLLDSDVWSPSLLLKSFYKTFFSVWNEYPNASKKTAWVTMEANKNNTANFIQSLKCDFKYIYVDRATEGTIATRYKRAPIEGFAETENNSKSNLNDFIENGEVWRLTRKRKDIQERESKYPDRFKIIRLEDAVSSTISTAKSLASFLGIQFDDILTKFTHCGKSFPGSDLYLKDLNDKYEKIFSLNELEVLRKEMERSLNENFPPHKKVCFSSRFKGFIKKHFPV